MKDIIQSLIENNKNDANQIAIKYNDESLTYGELNHYSNKCADMIAKSSRPVVIYGHMSPFMIVGMIGAIKAGCGYVPIDISIPQDRVEAIVNKVQPEFILNTSEAILPFSDITIFDVQCIIDHEEISEFESKMQPNDIVYTIFTSGSTGEPKGVQISYDSLNEFTQWMVELNQLGVKQQWLNQAPFSFDLSVMAIYPCLATIGTLNLVDKAMINKPKRLNDMLQQATINVWVSTPSFMEMCLMLPMLDQQQYPSLKEFFFCGEILAHRTAKMLSTKFPDAYIYNTYGPTEATVAVTSILINEEVLAKYNPLPVGQSRPGTQLHLTSEQELIISGNALSKGYLEDKVKTDAVFRYDNEIRNYYTGDKAEYKDNQWFINGRLDFQIKLNGYRMEIEEIEFQLRQSPSIQEAVVVPNYRDNKVTHINAVIITADTITQVTDEQAFIHEIKAELKQHLPEYMIPKKIMFTDRLPLTHNGKLDRKQIAEDFT
ncbi:D-alanine--poly(phosphoribitol) ligase subunit DltA [Staphylococcus gallinarum]|uniref:D-alanine--poly(phosphoribitol) ligase subunit DltA n=1 Tax=Staphylococcus gallinarum TaxID=1293 RepID=UPI001E3DE178|nr:D-alanine--poly(phosphoribitol) ligase subunit DltA [Staphylococcus gallinarum]MCD8828688.1 D-alanine--poly(phosphoribitol) ligase subunit DltA [Staphylococcus gallinarum]MDN6413619.1 D-alanine--poly(phosphoribitol) ligase subunit DltA [Staphylococcus gallinarum]MEB6054530.1 D-alanine--poly(phosphoribitol) ligase subunit DltA [Staphylococcus gallinarum]